MAAVARTSLDYIVTFNYYMPPFVACKHLPVSTYQLENEHFKLDHFHFV